MRGPQGHRGTIEGIANCAAALALAARESIELPTASVVQAALAQRLDDADSAEEITRLLISGLVGTPSLRTQ
jgi:glycerol-3-phosphate dehydrogenase